MRKSKQIWRTVGPIDAAYWERREGDLLITLEPRPAYCDRGSWIAKISACGPLWIDGADGWPRYYFDLTRAMLEIEAFIAKRKQTGELKAPVEKRAGG